MLLSFVQKKKETETVPHIIGQYPREIFNVTYFYMHIDVKIFDIIITVYVEFPGGGCKCDMMYSGNNTDPFIDHEHHNIMYPINK